MEPNRARPQAQRWLLIAEKLLTTRDFLGSKTFAIRARESDPMTEPADQILAVAETVIAGEKRINNQHDWYAILQLVHPTHDSELIATQYRRLALLLNPIKNRLAFADQAFKLVLDAWSVLSNPSKKSLYDNEFNLYSKLNPIGSTHQQEQVRQTHNKHHQHQQQQAVRRSPRKTYNDVNSFDKNVTDDGSRNDQNWSFWTACPYCYNMYEYPRVYAECILRCQNCRRAFQAVIIPSPPPICDGKEAYFCCWGFFPLAISASSLEKNKDRFSTWNPFTPMFTCPQVVEKKNGDEENVNVRATKNVNAGPTKNVNARKSSAPRVYIDDEDVFVGLSESSDDSDDDSDDEWNNTRVKKKAKSVKGKGLAGKQGRKPQADKAKHVNSGSGENLEGGFVVQEGVGVANVSVAETSKRGSVNNVKKQTGKGAKDWGKLDLNVEFSNEVEEPAPEINEGNRTGNGEEDNIEGIGFFEGLDEFLSTLPILSVVGDDKVKAT